MFFLGVSLRISQRSESFREEEWLKAILSSLNAKGKYAKVASVRLKGTMLAVFVKKELLNHVSGVATTTYPSGILGKQVSNSLRVVVGGNKWN